jgi:sodium/potassium-transporting ATPase subunit alpha
VAERIRWEDAEAGRQSRDLRRTHSRGSMSIHSVRSRREVDPSIALPIQYRTV